MNKGTYTDQHYFPQNQGFDYVGTFLPFTLEDTCDEDKVRVKSIVTYGGLLHLNHVNKYFQNYFLPSWINSN